MGSIPSADSPELEKCTVQTARCKLCMAVLRGRAEAKEEGLDPCDLTW